MTKLTESTWQRVYGAKQIDDDTAELKGYTFIENLFADSSQLGREDEPALTQKGLERELTALLREHGTLYATIRSAGMFQVNIGIWKKTGKPRAKTVGNNTLLIDDKQGFRVRLHATDIIKVEKNTLTLDCGGWRTPLTTKRMNGLLPSGMSVFRKNYELWLDMYGVQTQFNDDTLVFKGLTSAQIAEMRERADAGNF